MFVSDATVFKGFIILVGICNNYTLSNCNGHFLTKIQKERSGVLSYEETSELWDELLFWKVRIPCDNFSRFMHDVTYGDDCNRLYMAHHVACNIYK